MEKQFVEGMRVFKPRDNAPAFIKADITINTLELIAWLSKQDTEIRLQLKESKKGTLYLEVNNWQPSN